VGWVKMNLMWGQPPSTVPGSPRPDGVLPCNARNSYYRDSRDFKFPARFFCHASALHSGWKGRVACINSLRRGGGVWRGRIPHMNPAWTIADGAGGRAGSGKKRHLIVEAGTGTGKTLAYLLPVIRSGKRVIISTGTKNLQEQLFYKDIPFLEQALFGESPSGPRLSFVT